MEESSLTHLAVVLEGDNRPFPAPGDSVRHAGRILAVFEEVIQGAFALIPETGTLSLFSPDLNLIFRSLPEGADTDPLHRAMKRVALKAQQADAALLMLDSRGELPRWCSTSSFGPLPEGSLRRTVNLFLACSARQELARAARLWISTHAGEELSEETFASGLLTAGQPDPDFIIYAGGLLEPKDFLLWQSSYAEIWHTPKDGLSFSREDLSQALEGFRLRQRRFGALG